MKRVRVAVWGAGGITERGVLPVLSGPDVTSPPDAGPGWAQRPVGDLDLRFDAPARPELVALCDEDAHRLERVADQNRVRARYSEPRAMLREVAPDALLVAPSPLQVSALPDFLRFLAAKHPNVRVWLLGSPAPTSQILHELQRDVAARLVNVWLAQTESRAFAHRSARRAVENGEIGRVNGISLRASVAFPTTDALTGSDEARRFAGVYAVLHLLLDALSWAPQTGETAPPSEAERVVAGTRDSATNLWLRACSGATASATLSAGDNWNLALPRLELLGSEGRFMVCEGGRRVTLLAGREPARAFEAPSGTLFPSAFDLSGIAPDLRAFFRFCADEVNNAHLAASQRAWTQSLKTLQLFEAARASLHSGELVGVGASAKETDSRPNATTAGVAAPKTTPNLLSEPRAAPTRSRHMPALDTPTLPL